MTAVTFCLIVIRLERKPRDPQHLSVVGAHRSTASVGVGEAVALSVPGADQIRDGEEPVTPNTCSVLHSVLRALAYWVKST